MMESKTPIPLSAVGKEQKTFQQWYASNEKETKTRLAPVRRVFESNATFHKEVKKDLAKDDKLFDDFLKDPYNRHLRKSAVKGLIDKARDKQTGVKDARGKIANGFTEFAENLSLFVESFSGIIEVVRSVDDQYGGVAYGTFSILLIVAYNKKKKEDLIEETLAQMRDAFPQMEVLAETYPRLAPDEDNSASQIDVEQMVAELYEEVVNFARLATKYYQKSGFMRALSAIYDPPKLTIQKRVNTIKEKGAKVHSATGALLHKRVADILARSEAQQITIQRLEGKIQEGFTAVGRQQNKTIVNQEEARINHEHNLLLKLRRALITDEDKYQKHTNFKTLRALLQSNLPETSRRGMVFEQIDLARLSQETAFLRWQNSQGVSGVLLLSGQNHESATAHGFCWLSSAVTNFEEKLMAEDMGVQVARYSCCASGWGDSVTIDNVLTSIIFQVLNWSPGLMTSKYQEYKTLVESKKWKVEDYREVIESRVEWLVSILNFFQLTKPVYILIDRVDRALGKANGEDEEEEQLMDLVEALLQVAKGVNPKVCELKILVVSDSTLCRVRQSTLDRLQKKFQPVVFASRLGWNQELQEAPRSY